MAQITGTTLFFGQPAPFPHFFSASPAESAPECLFPWRETKPPPDKAIRKEDRFLHRSETRRAGLCLPTPRRWRLPFLAGRNKQKPCPLSRPKALQKHIGRRLPLLKIAGHRRHTQCFQPLRIGQGIPPFSAPDRGNAISVSRAERASAFFSAPKERFFPPAMGLCTGWSNTLPYPPARAADNPLCRLSL